jgi:hypothetical protein
MPLQATSGAASYDAFGGGVPVVPAYIEEIFSCFLYTGNGSTQTITNGIDLSTKGGMMWLARRDSAFDPRIWDTVRGRAYSVATDLTAAQTTDPAGYGLTSFNTDGFSVGPASSTAPNLNAASYVSWTFRKQPKFFDVVTYSGNNGVQNIAHNLGSVPGCIIVKETTGVNNWFVYHKDVGTNAFLLLETTNATISPGQNCWNNTAPTSTQFTVGATSNTNGTGSTYVAYLFAHNAGGFGLTGTDNVISCGSFTTDGSGNATVSLGYEPQWLLTKGTSAGNDWFINDNMRGLSYSTFAFLNPNYSSAETVLSGDYLVPNATGFTAKGFSGSTTFIYIAIRRGPMKVPTDATKVYETGTQLSTSPSFVSGFPVDFAMRKYTGISDGWNQVTRLQGTATLGSDSTAAETTGVTSFTFDYQTGWSTINSADSGIRSWMFRRAPSFMDVVCYTGTGANRTVSHNLGVVPELMIVKSRSAAGNQWGVYAASLGNTNVIYLNQTAATSANAFIWNNTSPTSTVFTVSIGGTVNTSAATYVAYLFASCAGVSKVGSYTGNGSTQTIDCGFGAGGVRFVIIKRTDSTGGWYLYDTARGMTVLTDPYLFLNTADAQTATLGSVTTVSTGFALNSAILAAINVSGGSYIFFAVA